jgi:hypothetical protein
MNKRKPESMYEILPYEEVSYYKVGTSIIDVSTNKVAISNWLDKRTDNIEDNSDIHMDIAVGPEGFHMSFHPNADDSFLLHMRINHVVALQIKQACEYYIKCYEEHRLQNDITIYSDVKFLQ